MIFPRDHIVAGEKRFNRQIGIVKTFLAKQHSIAELPNCQSQASSNGIGAETYVCFQRHMSVVIAPLPQIARHRGLRKQRQECINWKPLMWSFARFRFAYESRSIRRNAARLRPTRAEKPSAAAHGWASLLSFGNLPHLLERFHNYYECVRVVCLPDNNARSL